MKRSYEIITLAALSALIAFGSAGCVKEPGGANGQKSGERVRMRGALPTSGAQSPTRAKTVYGPLDGGLPPRQLDIGIVTVNHILTLHLSQTPVGLPDPTTDQPGTPEWAGQTADLMRGFFGSDDSFGVLPAGAQIDNGHIEYTNDSGDFIRHVFYPESLTEYFFVKAVYPYQGLGMFAQMPDGTGASVVFSGLTGHQDLMATNLGWGCQTQPVIQADDSGNEGGTSDVLKFAHLFAQLRFWVVAENETALIQYGCLDSLVVRFQPDAVVYRVMDGALMKPQSVRYIDYHSSFFFDGTAFNTNTIDFQTQVPIYNKDYTAQSPDYTPQGIPAGSVMVMPDYTYRIEAHTTKRNWIGADYDFRDSGGGLVTIEPGKIYDITLKFMEAYQLEILKSDVKEWWMDSVFN